ncbi:DUF86 domain-containing protein [Rhodococcus cerastii]|nr:DUF86 domain-containing protein [Rhodococcus cerastii]
MSRGVDQRITDVLYAIDRCQRYLGALNGEAEDLAGMAEDAIERNLQIIGEAVNHLPAEITHAHAEIAWPQIRGFRNILVHQYFGVEIDVVRDVVVTYLPPLREALRQHVGDLESRS